MLKILGILLAYPILGIVYVLIRTATALTNLAELISCGQKARRWEARFYWRDED